MGAEQPLDADEYGRWLTSAERALLIARDLHGLSRHEVACFHAEQAAQLALKALLRGVGVPSFGHDVLDLARRVGGAMGASFGDIGVALSRLSRYSIPTRYPDAWAGGTPADHYGAEDSADAIAEAEAVVDAVGSAWSQLMSAVDATEEPDAD
jgi:HEPN domain-containing protein